MLRTGAALYEVSDNSKLESAQVPSSGRNLAPDVLDEPFPCEHPSGHSGISTLSIVFLIELLTLLWFDPVTFGMP